MKVVRLLWIDDVEKWALKHIQLLQELGEDQNIDFNIVHLPNGEDLHLYVNINLDAIIMDYMMEPKNGAQYIRELRFEEHLELVPIFFYSENPDANLEELSAGLKDIIPVYRRHLVNKILENFSS